MTDRAIVEGPEFCGIRGIMPGFGVVALACPLESAAFAGISAPFEAPEPTLRPLGVMALVDTNKKTATQNRPSYHDVHNRPLTPVLPQHNASGRVHASGDRKKFA